ncbi:MAG: hypothetical protein JWQ72_3120 [Polaromonas sp.]|nr:hypothetical protein [Polaromonas sp.]
MTLRSARRLGAALLLCAAVAAAWLAPLDAPATAQVDAGLSRALTSFATARALHGVLSVVQGTQFSAQPLGVGISLTPGQLLAPVNDLVKHFSDLMLAASVAFGVQKAVIAIGSYWPISAALTLAALAWGVAWFRQGRPGAWLSRTLVVLLMLRFAVPVAVLGTDVLWQKFLAADYAVTQQAMDTASGQALRLGPPVVAPADAGMLDKIREWVTQTTDVRARFEDIKRAVERVTEHVIRLMVIFLLQTLILPVLLLWGLYAALKALVALPLRLRTTAA